MKLSLDLTFESPKAWIEAVLGDFPAFLQDHADCERKASAMAMSFVAKYPDRVEIIPELIETGVEELQHFQQVYRVMEARGIRLQHEIPQDLYIKALLNLCHSDRERRFLDRLLIASIVECRGAERFRILAQNLSNDKGLQEFYHGLWTSEARHGNIFVKMALNYFKEDQVLPRLETLNKIEGDIVKGLPIRPALH